MDVQLKELIERIKSEGVKSAEDNAARIISSAEREAENILNNARQEARRLREVAEVDVKRFERSGNESVRQAGRDLLLSVRSSLEEMFKKIVEMKISTALDETLLSKAISAAITNISLSTAENVEIQIPEDEFKKVEPGLRNALADEISKGAKIVPVSGLDSGFRISMKNGSIFYDFTDQQIASMLSAYLNPRLAKYLTE